jgi:CHAT domain-containing protein
VATLWPVRDVETADLVGAFFTELKGGASPTAALARAKRLMLSDPRTAHPFYWAGLVIGGAE